MQFQAKTFLDRNGRPFVLRNAALEVVATNQRAIALLLLKRGISTI